MRHISGGQRYWGACAGTRLPGTSPVSTQSGSITVVVSAVVVLLVVVASMGAGVVAVFAAQVRASQAADLAALAGAQRAWLDPSDACPAALMIVKEHSARALDCFTDALDVQVRVAVDVPSPLRLLGEVRAVARAGPPE